MLQMLQTNRFVPSLLAASMSCVFLTACGVDDKPTINVGVGSGEQDKGNGDQGSGDEKSNFSQPITELKENWNGSAYDIWFKDPVSADEFKKIKSITIDGKEYDISKFSQANQLKSIRTEDAEIIKALKATTKDKVVINSEQGNGDEKSKFSQPITELKKNWDDSAYDIWFKNPVSADEFKKIKSITVDGKEYDISKFSQANQLKSIRTEDADIIKALKATTKDKVVINMKGSSTDKDTSKKIAISAIPTLGQAGVDKYEDGIFIENEMGIKSCDKATVNGKGKVIVPGLKDADHCGLLAFTVSLDFESLGNVKAPVTVDYKLVSKDGSRNVSDILQSDTPATGTITLGSGQDSQKALYFQLKSDGKKNADWNLALELFNPSDNVTLDKVNKPLLNVVVKDATGTGTDDNGNGNGNGGEEPPVVDSELKLADKTEFKISLDNMKTASDGQGKGYLIAYDPFDKNLAGTINNNIHVIYPFANVGDKYAHIKYKDAKWKDNVSFEIDGGNSNYEIIKTQAGANKSIYTLKQVKATKEGLTINVLVDGVKQSSFKVVVDEKGEVAEPKPVENKFVVTDISKWNADSNNIIDFEQAITDDDFAKIKSITIAGKTFDKEKFTRVWMNKSLRSNDAEVLKALKTATKADVKVNLEGDSSNGGEETNAIKPVITGDQSVDLGKPSDYSNYSEDGIQIINGEGEDISMSKNKDKAYIFSTLGDINADSVAIELDETSKAKYVLASEETMGCYYAKPLTDSKVYFKDHKGEKEELCVKGTASGNKITKGTIKLKVTGTYGEDKTPFEGVYTLKVTDKAGDAIIKDYNIANDSEVADVYVGNNKFSIAKDKFTNNANATDVSYEVEGTDSNFKVIETTDDAITIEVTEPSKLKAGQDYEVRLKAMGKVDGEEIETLATIKFTAKAPLKNTLVLKDSITVDEALYPSSESFTVEGLIKEAVADDQYGSYSFTIEGSNPTNFTVEASGKDAKIIFPENFNVNEDTNYTVTLKATYNRNEGKAKSPEKATSNEATVKFTVKAPTAPTVVTTKVIAPLDNSAKNNTGYGGAEMVSATKGGAKDLSPLFLINDSQTLSRNGQELVLYSAMNGNESVKYELASNTANYELKLVYGGYSTADTPYWAVFTKGGYKAKVDDILTIKVIGVEKNNTEHVASQMATVKVVATAPKVRAMVNSIVSNYSNMMNLTKLVKVSREAIEASKVKADKAAPAPVIIETKLNDANGVLSVAKLTATGQPAEQDKDWACSKDNVTGLVWERKPHNRTYSYTDATGYTSALNAKSLCGISNWRLPTSKEVIDVVDLTGNQSDLFYGLSAEGDYVWTQTVVPSDATVKEQWLVSPSGQMAKGKADDSNSVLAVATSQ